MVGTTIPGSYYSLNLPLDGDCLKSGLYIQHFERGMSNYRVVTTLENDILIKILGTYHGKKNLYRLYKAIYLKNVVQPKLLVVLHVRLLW